ncbi:MAG: type II toxin-antitoxin system Phd/YefM family antitoxin [Oscillospiraceae bacterium]|nr:type II toxin-antitoxin system Phd/YefM family antitoxin [Oscillospiraceae bacterium]
MTAINATTARKNLYQLISDVNANSAPITITNSRGKNAVLMSEDDWNAIQETMYLNSVSGMAESILASRDEPIEDSAVYTEGEEW